MFKLINKLQWFVYETLHTGYVITVLEWVKSKSPSYTFTILAMVELQLTLIYQIMMHQHDT